MAAKLYVEKVGENLWQVRYVSGEQVVVNVFPHEGKPRITVEKQSDGGVVLHTQDRVEVGRYNEAWAGHEVPCEESHEPTAVDG